MPKKQKKTSRRTRFKRAYKKGGGSHGAVETILYATGIGAIVAGNDAGYGPGSPVEVATTPDPTYTIGRRITEAFNSMRAQVAAGGWIPPIVGGVALDTTSKVLKLRSHSKLTKHWSAI